MADAFYLNTAGLRGGDGGRAGLSGHGAGGPSIAIVHDGAAPKMTATTLVHGAGGDGVPAATQNGLTIGASVSGPALDELVATGELVGPG
jgi:hypothetical protein